MLAALLCLLGCRSSSVDAPESYAVPPPPRFEIAFQGNLSDPQIEEASGIAASRRRTDVLWIINDGEHGPYLYAVSLQGEALGRVEISSAENVDWEDLSAFQEGGRPYLLIADFGDNREQRRLCTLYVVPEPHFTEGLTGSNRAGWERRIDYVYEDGPRDSEGVAVDVGLGEILIMTKRTEPPLVYTLPLAPAQAGIQVARRRAKVRHIPPPTAADLADDPVFGRFRSQPTAMDISPDGAWIVVLTYKNAYLYPMSKDTLGKALFQPPPISVHLPPLRQAEAICFSADGKRLFVTSEKIPAPLYSVILRE